MVKTKFKCTSIQEYESVYAYQLNPVYGGEENRAYWEATPSGSLNLSIIKSKGKLFEVGKEYHVDIWENEAGAF